MHAERRILHVDMDAYFAALEVQACPRLAGRPLIVGALPGSRGVVASASYEARASGVRAGMPASHARRLCPQAEFVPCHPALYIHTSRRLLQHLLRFTPRVEMFSIDEAFLDATDLPGSGGADLERLAREIAASVERGFGLTCSIGAGPNKLIAKMASKLKKPRGITVLGRSGFLQRFWSRPVEDLFGVGEKTASSLLIFGIERIGELAETPVQFLRERFGLYGEVLHAMAWGLDDAPVRSSLEAPPAKSLGHEHTLARDLEDPAQALGLILSLSERVTADLRREGYTGRCVVLKMRYSDFATLTRQRTLPFPTQEPRDVYRCAKDLFRDHYCGQGIRLIGITAADLLAADGRVQLGLFPEDRRYRRFVETVDQVRDQFGYGSLQPAGAMPAAGGSPGPPGDRHARTDHPSHDVPSRSV